MASSASLPVSLPVKLPVGCQNSATASDQGFYTACRVPKFGLSL